MAERVGFEPTGRFPVRSLSRRVLSTAQSPLRGRSTVCACCVLKALNRNRPLRASAMIVRHQGALLVAPASCRRFFVQRDCVVFDRRLAALGEEFLDYCGALGSQNARGHLYLMV